MGKPHYGMCGLVIKVLHSNYPRAKRLLKDNLLKITLYENNRF